MLRLVSFPKNRVNQGQNPPRQTLVEHERYGALFDAWHYRRKTNCASIESAIEHYESEGYLAGHSPHPLFADSYYREQAGLAVDENPLVHFRDHGWKDGLSPHPLFDTGYYLDQVGELGNHKDPLSHYLTEGWKNEQSPSRWVHLEYCRSLMPKRWRQRVEPLTWMCGVGLTRVFRPHPFYFPQNLSIQLRLRSQPVNGETLCQSFRHWDASFSPSPLFDVHFYKQEHPESAEYPGGPLEHFLTVGQNQDFDPTPYFNSEFYRRRYGQRLNGLSPFMHFMIHERTLAFDPHPNINLKHYGKQYPSIQKSKQSLLEHFLSVGRFRGTETERFELPGFIEDQISELSGIEPEIACPKKVLNKVTVYNRHQSVKSAEHYQLLRDHVQHDFRILVLVPFLSRGGADLIACHTTRVLQDQYGVDNVLVVLTDGDNTDSVDWLPVGTRWVALSHFGGDMKPPVRQAIVQCLIEDFRPDACFNLNSKVAWELYSSKGKPLSRLTNLFATVFCFDYDKNMKPVGYGCDYVGKSIEHLTALYGDNATFLDLLRRIFNMPPQQAAKLRVAYTPAKTCGYSVNQPALLERLDRPSSYRRKVMWAGRLDRQKRPELMMEIARRCPEFDFHVFGTHVLEKTHASHATPGNIVMRGEYQEFFDLPLDEMDLFLYTAAWDGLPCILIESLQAGLPTIAPDVGGIHELIHDDSGWLIQDSANPDAFASLLQEIAYSPEQCGRRVINGRQRVEQQHSWLEFSSAITAGFKLPITSNMQVK